MKLSVKSWLIIYLVISTFALQMSSKIHTSSINKLKQVKRTASELKISKQEKLEAFFRGFTIAALSRIARGQNTENGKDQISFDEHMRKVSSQVITNCVPEFLNEYDAVIRQSKSKKGYDDHYLKIIFEDK